MKDLIRNLTVLGILLPLFHSLPSAAQLMADSAAGFADIPTAQSSLRSPNDFANGAKSHPALYMQPEVPVRRDTKFRWRIATQESLLFTGIMHAFNLAT